MFANWMESCRMSRSLAGERRYFVQCNGLEVGMNRAHGEIPEQAPFAVVVGCSDARVPTEMLFGQGFNDLFVIRVAGNVLGDVCMGSIEFALAALSSSVKCVVMLGHSGCGAVTGAVDCYLSPTKFWTTSFPPMLKTIIQRIFVAVRESANALREVWGADAREVPGYREALVDMAVSINAAHAAFDLRQQVERAGKSEIKVLYGVFSLHNHQVSMPVNPWAPVAPENVNLAYAPTNPREFNTIALQMAELLKTAALAPTGRPGPGDGSPQAGSATTRKAVSNALKNELLLRPDDHLGTESP
jgi:carbonic anhydrase